MTLRLAHFEGPSYLAVRLLRTPLGYGIFMALGADILPTGPLLGISAAVTRPGMSGTVHGENERLTVPEAIVGYPRNGVYFITYLAGERVYRAPTASRETP